MDILDQIANQTKSIPPEQSWDLQPAQFCLYEWQDYWLNIPSADRIRVGNEWFYPVSGNVFQIRFENQLGLASIQPFAGSMAISPPIYVEVISPKFPSPSSHIAFYSWK